MLPEESGFEIGWSASADSVARVEGGLGMAQDAEHVVRLKEAYRLWDETKGRSAEHWVGLFAEGEVRVRSLARGTTGMEFTQDRRSKAEVRQYFQGLAADWQMIHYTPEEFIVDGERVVMIGRCAFRHRRTGKTVDTPKCDVWHFRGGQAVDFLEFYDTAQILEATR
jgi:ketosteroid isomerase-like protein